MEKNNTFCINYMEYNVFKTKILKAIWSALLEHLEHMTYCFCGSKRETGAVIWASN